MLLGFIKRKTVFERERGAGFQKQTKPFTRAKNFKDNA